jgi:hypothetical protein
MIRIEICCRSRHGVAEQVSGTGRFAACQSNLL